MPGSRSRSRSGTRRRLGARRSPLGMRRSYRNSRADKSASKWAKRGIGHIPNSRSRRSWAQKAIKDAWRNRKSRMAKKTRAMMATSRGSMAGLPLELRNKIRNLTKRGGYKYKRSRSRSRSSSRRSSRGSKKTKRKTRRRTRKGSRRS